MTTEVISTAQGPVSVERHGSGRDIVMLHSLMSDRGIFDAIVPSLSQTHRVNLVDLPGYGSTRRVDTEIEAFADVIGALLTDGGYDPDTTVLMGNGLGGFVTLGTAVRYGGRFERMILVGCGAGFDDHSRTVFRGMAEAVQAGGMQAVVEQAIRRIFPESYLVAHPDEADVRRAVLLRTDPAAFRDACLALAGLDYRAAAGSVTNPTLIVVGSDDTATPPAMCRDLADRIPGAAYHGLPGLAHAPQLQDPDAFLEAITPFLGDTA